MSDSDADMAGVTLAADQDRCLPLPASADEDLTYIGRGKNLTLEQNDWLGHAVTTQTAALLLREVLGFDVNVIETPMAWDNAQDDPLSRLASGEVDANLEGWSIDWPSDLMRQYVDQSGEVERSIHAFQGRVGAYVPRYVVEDNPGIFPDYWRAYTQPEVLDVFRWDDQAALDTKRQEWAENCDADAYGCDGGEWRPPMCGSSENGTSANGGCIPFFHVYPDYAVGWIEQLVQNLNLNISVYYAGWDLYDLIRQLKEERRPILFYSWRPHELLAKNEYVRITFPERNQVCEALDTDSRFGGRDCDHEGSPVYKLTTSSLGHRSRAAHEFIHKRYSLSLGDQYSLLADLEAGGHGGNLTTEQAACQWAKDNQAIWSEWTLAVASEPPPCSEISLDQIGQFPVSQQQEIHERCFAADDSTNWAAVFGGLFGVIAFLTAILAYVYVERRKRNGDSVWAVKTSEIKFHDPPQIAGRGTFGLVLIAEYRGTQVAVKRVIPPKKRTAKSSMGSGGANGLFDMNAAAGVVSGSNSKHNSSGTSQQLLTSGTHKSGSSRSLINPTGSGVGGGSGAGGQDGSPAATKSSKSSARKAQREYTRLKADFVSEMRYLSKLRHPCVTTVMGAVTEKGQEPMLVMELMEHGSLYDILHNETFPIDSDLLLPILRDIASGVRFLHAATPEVLHGDLKAQNVLVDAKFRAKVADFGLSQKKNLGGTGTPYWMAPELLRQETTNTTASDVFSFGIILFEVYSRRDPYEDEDPAEVLRLVADKSVRKRPPVPRNMPDKVKSLMADCVEDDAEMRPSFEELDTRLKRIDAETADPSRGLQTSNKPSSISLFDIFPRHIAEALRDGRSVDSEHHDCVTIFFSDIVGFTNISSQLEPRKIADMLDRLYTKFDKLSQKHDIFKVETIGDAYMAVTNLVKDQKDDHAKRIAEFSLDAIAAANSTLIDREDPGKGCVNIRVGFHSGSVVADVVGTRNPRYCLFGDTVNTASRMESNSVVNRIHCSKPAAKLLHKQCPSLPIKSRGIIPIKGKGEMQTFWVNEEGVEGARASIADASSEFLLPSEPEHNAMKTVKEVDPGEFEVLSHDIEAPAYVPTNAASTAPPESAIVQPRGDEDSPSAEFIRSKLEKRLASYKSGHSSKKLDEVSV